MKSVLVLAALVAFAVCAPLITQDFIDEINSKQDLWVAGVNPRFENMSLEEMKGLLGVKLPQARTHFRIRRPATEEANDLPETFDMRDKWPSCKGKILDQGQCGSCWAFGAVEAFEDRVCIAKSASEVVFLSTQTVVDCQKDTCYGCQGGWPEKAFEYIVNKGIPTEKCNPYKAYDRQCTQQCADGSAFEPVRGASVTLYNSLNEVKNDIFTFGPIETWFAVYNDFFSYTSGVYTPTSRSLAGYHAVEVLGWGVEKDTKYWLAANSWGLVWGMKGYFKIAAGTCQFDDIDHFVSGTFKA